MMRNIFLAVVSVITLYVGYNIYTVFEAHRHLEDVPAGYSEGPEDADISVVMFFDYACTYCREAFPTVTQAVRTDGKVRFIPRPLPTQDQQSLNNALLAYAAGDQGKFVQMNAILMENFRAINEQTLQEIATQAGLDLDMLQKDMDTEKLQKSVQENERIFRLLGGRATPTFVIGKKIFYVPEGTMPTVDDFLRMFAEARSLE